jgi:hypothetical protein
MPKTVNDIVPFGKQRKQKAKTKKTNAYSLTVFGLIQNQQTYTNSAWPLTVFGITIQLIFRINIQLRSVYAVEYV